MASLWDSASLALYNYLPQSLTDNTFASVLAEDINMKRWVQQMMLNIEQACSSSANSLGPAHSVSTPSSLHDASDDLHMQFDDTSAMTMKM
jgi:hypothetical protein